MDVRNLWLSAASTALAFVGGIAVTAYVTVPNPQLEFRGGDFLAFDPEIGMVAQPDRHALRVDGPTSNRGPLTYDIYTDRNGARVDGPEEQTAASVGADIVAIGCSFTWGHPIANRDTYVSRVRQEVGTSVSNLALPGYGTTESLLTLRRNRRLSPKLVIYGFVSAHLDRNVLGCAPSYHPFCFDVAHVGWDTAGQPEIRPPLSNGVQRARQHLTGPPWNPMTWLGHGLDVLYGRLILARDNANTPDATRREEAFAFLFRELQQSVKDMKAELLVVHIPTRYEEPPPELLRHLGDTRFLDVSPAFNRHRQAAGAALHVVDDGHPNELAHGIIATEIAGYIKRQGLLAP